MNCNPVTLACQYFGHYDSDNVCDREKGQTIMDKPMCSNERCPNPDLLISSHSLFQPFRDEEMNDFGVHFKDPTDVDDFFSRFPAQKCLDNDRLWCEFQATKCWHRSRFDCGKPVFFRIVVFQQKEVSSRYYHVSGKLPSIDFQDV